MHDSREYIFSFAERCASATSVDEIALTFIAEVEKLGFENVALCSHVDPLHPPSGAVAIFKYPRDWLEYFSDKGYDRIDPVFSEASCRGTPFLWDDPAFLGALDDAQREILREGAEAGLAHGLSIPSRIPGALPASCSLVAGKDGVDPLSYPTAHSLAVFAHEHARRILGEQGTASAPRLSNRERACLALAAHGKSDWAISKLIGVSQSTVHHAIESAKQRFGVATRVQAVVRAVLSGQIDAGISDD